MTRWRSTPRALGRNPIGRRSGTALLAERCRRADIRAGGAARHRARSGECCTATGIAMLARRPGGSARSPGAGTGDPAGEARRMTLAERCGDSRLRRRRDPRPMRTADAWTDLFNARERIDAMSLTVIATWLERCGCPTGRVPATTGGTQDGERCSERAQAAGARRCGDGGGARSGCGLHACAVRNAAQAWDTKLKARRRAAQCRAESAPREVRRSFAVRHRRPMRCCETRVATGATGRIAWRDCFTWRGRAREDRAIDDRCLPRASRLG